LNSRACNTTCKKTIDPSGGCAIIVLWRCALGAVMKFRHAFIFIPCLIVSLGSAVTPGLAVTHITSADTLTISLGALPPATYATAGVQLNFTDFGSNTGPDVLDAGEGFRLNLFNSGNSLVSQVSFTSLSGGLAVSVGTVGPVGNTGHLFIDQIVGSFDLYSVIISGSITNQFFPESATTSFTVGTATPLPAALPLFACGIGVIGLLARRRKQRASARLH